MYLFAAVVGLCSFEICSSDSGGGGGGQHWTYHDQGGWPTLCRSGRRQSPVNIDSARAVSAPAEPLQFSRYDNVELSGTNNGHTVKFSVEGAGSERPELSGGPLLQVYTLEQLHFHWLGEHAINHVKYPLEIHFVHRLRVMPLDQAKFTEDGIVVVAVLFQVTTDLRFDNTLGHLSRFVPELINASSQVSVGRVDLSRVLSPELNSYYTYRGSLTTPDCLEVVRWIVFDTPVNTTDLQYQQFSAVQVGGISNFRSLQPLNGRVIYRTPVNSSAVTQKPYLHSIATAVAGILTATNGAAAAVAAIIKASFETAFKIKKHIVGLNISSVR